MPRLALNSGWSHGHPEFLIPLPLLLPPKYWDDSTAIGCHYNKIKNVLVTRLTGTLSAMFVTCIQLCSSGESKWWERQL